MANTHTVQLCLPSFLPSLPSLRFLLMLFRKLLVDGKLGAFLRSELGRPRHLDRCSYAEVKAGEPTPWDSSVADLWTC